MSDVTRVFGGQGFEPHDTLSKKILHTAGVNDLPYKKIIRVALTMSTPLVRPLMHEVKSQNFGHDEASYLPPASLEHTSLLKTQFPKIFCKAEFGSGVKSELDL